jgi:hypothetical protein
MTKAVQDLKTKKTLYRALKKRAEACEGEMKEEVSTLENKPENERTTEDYATLASKKRDLEALTKNNKRDKSNDKSDEKDNEKSDEKKSKLIGKVKKGNSLFFLLGILMMTVAIAVSIALPFTTPIMIGLYIAGASIGLGAIVSGEVAGYLERKPDRKINNLLKGLSPDLKDKISKEALNEVNLAREQGEKIFTKDLEELQERPKATTIIGRLIRKVSDTITPKFITRALQKKSTKNLNALIDGMVKSPESDSDKKSPESDSDKKSPKSDRGSNNSKEPISEEEAKKLAKGIVAKAGLNDEGGLNNDKGGLNSGGKEIKAAPKGSSQR